MLQHQRVPDKDLLKLVTQRLARTGLASQTPVTAIVRNGNVTLSGIIHFEYQRKAAIKAVQTINGVQHVLDQLRVQPATAKWQAMHGSGHPTAAHGAHVAPEHPAGAHPATESGEHPPEAHPQDQSHA